MSKLYTAQVCPFAHRCRLLATHLGVPHERVEMELGNLPDWYRQLSPNQAVPLWQEDDGRLVWESAIINEYLFECARLQVEPYQRARERLAIEAAGSSLIPGFYATLRGEEGKRADQHFERLVNCMEPKGPYWLGEQPGLADFAIYPWFERWGALTHYSGLELSPPARIASWLEAMQGLAAVQREKADLDIYVAGDARYARPTA